MNAICGFFVAITLSLCSYAQSSRSIYWPPAASEQAYVIGDSGRQIPSNSKALEIVDIKVEGKTIVPGQPFSAGNDWLKTFAVKVRNVSDRNIVSIRLFFSLPETKSGDKQAGFSLEYGKELSTGTDYGVQAPVEPGQEVVLGRNDRHYARDTEGIAKRSGITDFNTVIIAVSQVMFADTQLWSSYRLPITSAPTAHN